MTVKAFEATEWRIGTSGKWDPVGCDKRYQGKSIDLHVVPVGSPRGQGLKCSHCRGKLKGYSFLCIYPARGRSVGKTSRYHIRCSPIKLNFR